MNTSVAKSIGLPIRPHYYYKDFYSFMYKCLKANQTQLNKFKLPNDDLNEISFQTWDKVKTTDWWLRRVLDIAILIRTNSAKAVYPNLEYLIREKVSNQRSIQQY
jgi:hypothetical protein